MSENLKVNAKTSLLEFKRKHNKLVDQVNNAGKEILSKIKIEYDEVNDVTNIEFPIGILPLQLSINTNIIFTKNGKAVNDKGEEYGEYDLDEIYVDEGKLNFSIIGDISEQVINGLIYINSSGNDILLDLINNSYYLFYPQIGTKLYMHEINFVTNHISKGILIQDESYPIIVISTSKEPYNFTDGLSLSIADGTAIAISNGGTGLFGWLNYDGTDIELDTNLVNGIITYEQVSSITDTVSEM